MRAAYLLTALCAGNLASTTTSGNTDVYIPDGNEGEAGSLTSRSIERRNLITDILKDITNSLAKVGDALTCVACEAIFTALKEASALGDDIFLGVFKLLCEAAGLFAGSQIGQICSGAVGLEGPILAQVLRDMEVGGPGMTLLCNFIFGLCPPPDLSWTVPMPGSKSPNAKRPAPSGKKPIQVVQYSDLHVDPEYTAGASTNCSNPILCCRPYSQEDEPGNNNSPASLFGEHKCDPPPRLQDSMLRAIKKIAPDAAFTIFTGDIIEHQIWNTSKDMNELQINQSYDDQSSFFELVYGVVGNHESSPVNAFPPKKVDTRFDTQWVFGTISAKWSRWITGEAAKQDALHMGSYSVKYPHGNLRIISIDTNYYYNAAFWMYDDDIPKDPKNQLAWLVRELQAAEQAKENVYIIGHMPMGNADAFRHYSNYFNQIINRYSASIAAMFWGHTHLDHFEITYSDYAHRSPSTATAIGYICPALTPLEGMPAFRVYDIDPETFAVLDYETYIANMDDPSFSHDPVWERYYSAKEAYGAALNPPMDGPGAEMTPAFWHNVTELFKANETLFKSYYARKTRGWNVPDCTGNCRSDEICELQSGRSEDNCHPAELFSYSADQPSQGNHCGSSVGMMILKSLDTKTAKTNLNRMAK